MHLAGLCVWVFVSQYGATLVLIATLVTSLCDNEYDPLCTLWRYVGFNCAVTPIPQWSMVECHPVYVWHLILAKIIYRTGLKPHEDLFQDTHIIEVDLMQA